MNSPVGRVLVFMAGRDCERYVEAAIRSVAAQTWTQLHVLFVDDASQDRTSQRAKAALAAHLPGRHSFVRNPRPWGKARNASEHLRAALQDGDVVAVVDADDRLVDDHIVEDVSRLYRQGFDVVWSNYRTDLGGLGGNRPLDPFASPRSQGWSTSHFFTFRGCLLTEVPQHYFQDAAGAWLTSACDFALAYPVLDQTRRYAFVPRAAYEYTASNPTSHHNRDPEATGLSSGVQQANARTVLEKPPLPCVRFATEEPAVLQAALSYTQHRLDERLNRLTASVQRLQTTSERAPFQALALEALTAGEGVPLAWLRDVGGWALDAEFLHHLSAVLDRYEQPRVLEFGSGRGTKSLARLVQRRGGTLVSLDHDEEWFQATSAELARHGLADTAAVLHCPLRPVDFYGVPGRFYDMSWLQGDDVFDVVVVDGPPTVTSALARLPALPSIAAHLSPKGFDVFLDDYERDVEQRIVEIWRTVAPDLSYATLSFAKDVCAISE